MSARRPIFILGVMPRTGTVFLSGLLSLHPDCAMPKPIWEDYLLAHAEPLIAYASTMTAFWQATLNVPADEVPRVARALGDGLLSALTDAADGRRLVTKTPTVDNLPYFFDLFPDAQLILLVRDGRAAVESYVRSFGGGYGRPMRMWAAGARAVRDFAASPPDGSFRVVRYEDLVRDLDGELERLLEFCELDASRYDFEAARNLPVRGSSRLRAPSGELSWRPQRRPADFDASPQRAWSRGTREEFELVAGDLQRAFGYEPDGPAARRPVTRMRRAVNDSRWSGVLGRIERRVRA